MIYNVLCIKKLFITTVFGKLNYFVYKFLLNFCKFNRNLIIKKSNRKLLLKFILKCIADNNKYHRYN